MIVKKNIPERQSAHFDTLHQLSLLPQTLVLEENQRGRLLAPNQL
jgi:hypothetical protein